MNEVEEELNEVGLLDIVTRRRGWELEIDDTVTARNQCQQHQIPEDIMSELYPFIGDAMAKLTVGADLAHSKDYGCKAGAFVSVSVHCDLSEEGIKGAHDIVQPFVQSLVEHDVRVMTEARDQHLMELNGEAPRQGKNPSSKAPLKAPTKKSSPKSSKKSSPKSGVTRKKGNSIPRPNFRR